jgi:hypothetical protein
VFGCICSHLRFYDSVAALTATYPASRPKLILAIPPSMSHGPSRTLFTQLASNLNTLIVLTSRGEPNTLSSELFELWNQRQERGKKAGEGEVGVPLGADQKFEVEVGHLLFACVKIIPNGRLLKCYRSNLSHAAQHQSPSFRPRTRRPQRSHSSRR